MSKQPQQASFLQRLYTLITSMKFAIVILIVLGVTSLISMLVNEYPAIFAEDSIINQLFQQHSPYSSLWYSILLWFLIISVLLCVIQNIGPTVKTVFNPRFVKTNNLLQLPGAVQTKVSKSLNTESIKKILKKQLFRFSETEIDGEKLITAQKFRWSALGHIITHISLLIIVLGGIIYSKTDRQEFRYIIADEHRNTEYFQNFPELFQWHFSVTDDNHPTMLVDSFRVKFYDKGSGPSISDFRSYVRVLDHDGNVIKRHEITVNDPLKINHVSIHQSDYKPLINEFFLNIPNRRQIIGQAQTEQEFERNETNWITGLSLRANRGKPIIFTGMLISALGLILSFMFWPRNIWISIKDQTMTVAGRTSKNKITFQTELNKIIAQLKNEK